MKHNLEFLKADIQDELNKLEFLKSEFYKSLRLLPAFLKTIWVTGLGIGTC